MFKSIGIAALSTFLITSTLPVRTETKVRSTLNYNQPYKDQWENNGKKRIPFKSVEDNDNLWADVIKSRNKSVGYNDTEFAKRLNYCRYIGESIVLQKKEEFILENVLKYMIRCNNTQQQMITHYLDKTYTDVEEDRVLSKEMISLYVFKEDEEVNKFMTGE